MHVSMPSHLECLQGICRLCGEGRAIVQGRSPIPKESLSKNIEAALGLSIAEDIEGVHPPSVCKVCEGKLKRWWSLVKRRNIKASCNITPVSFNTDKCEKCRGGAEEVCLSDVEAEAKGKGLVTWQGPGCLQIMKMCVTTYLPVLFLTIFESLAWTLVVKGIPAERGNQIWSAFPDRLGRADAHEMLDLISMKFICEGNRDFPQLVEAEKGAKGQIPTSITPQDVYVEGTIRHVKCQLLIPKEGRCEVCQVYRNDLMAKNSKNKMKTRPAVSTSSSVTNRNLTKKELEGKVSLLQAERRSLKRKAATLQIKIADMLKRDSVDLSTEQDEALRAAVIDSDAAMGDILQQDSPAHLLWVQQRESALKGKQMRWHPAIIRWCIALQSKSSSAYNLLRQTKFLRLPHPSTLHPYTHFADPVTGFNPAMLQRVVADNSIESCPEHEKIVSVLFDEMKIKAGLGFSVRSGKVLGFTDVGSIANEISDFERKCRGEKRKPASHVLVLMVRGIFSNLHAAIAYYPTCSATSDQLCSIIWEAIFFLEVAGLRVWALVSDGASSNRKFYRLHGDGSGDIPVHCCVNPYDPNRKVYFVCDVPHLIKTTRNNLENSGYNNSTKTLMFNNQKISWVQLLQLYEWDVGMDRQSPGLRRLHRLTYEHLHLTPALRMRVYLAAQVLSSTVANALEAQGKPGTQSLVKFIRSFDTFFDCLNVSSVHKGTRQRKPALEPYRTVDDWRFEWLTKDFLGFLKEWDDDVESKGLDKTAKKKMSLSKETKEGLKITVYSFVEMAKTLLQLPGITYLLSEKLSQDPLEGYFSKQRGAGGACDNPTVEQFGHNMLTLQVASSCIKASKKANVRQQHQGDDSLDGAPLPRRK